jgi:hypothetical protein
MHPQMRVSDADRRRTVTVLENHTAAGRLDLAEFSERADRAWLARTAADLLVLTDDLPAVDDAVWSDRRQGDRHRSDGHRSMAPILMVLVAILAPLGVLGVLSALAGGASMMAGVAAMCGMG